MITVFNSKGGVGKSSLSYSISVDLDMPLISNDDSMLLRHHKDSQLFEDQEIPIVKGALYDLGGFNSPYIGEILERSDAIIVPVSIDYNSIKRGVQILQKYKHKKTILIANMIENIEDFEYIKDVVRRDFDSLVFPLQKSIIFRRSLESGMSVKELVYENGLSRYSYRKFYKQYDTILQSLAKS